MQRCSSPAEPTRPEAVPWRRFIMMTVALCSWLAVPLPADAEICFTGSEHSTIMDISPLGDIRLASGNLVHLSDVTLPENNRWHERAILRLKDFTSAPVTVKTGSSPDRWGRYRARLILEDGNSDLAENLLHEGLALVDAGEADHLCRASLLAIEQQARSAKTGLWSEGDLAPLAAAQTDELLRRVGRFTLVEGRVRSIGERSSRTYLNFGRDWKTDFTVTISKQVWADMQRNGIDTVRLKAGPIRLRGVIRDWNGPALDVLAWETVEFITDVRSHTGVNRSK